MSMTIRVALLAPLLFAACTSGRPTDAPASAPAGPDALTQVGRWTLQGATDARGRPLSAALPNGKAVHAVVFAHGRLVLEGGCNNIGGPYAIDVRGRLVVTEIQSTLKACADQALMAGDAAVSGLLQGESEWRIAESYPEQLFLEHAGGMRSQWVADRPAQ